MVQDAKDGSGVLPAAAAIDQQQGLQPLDLQTRLVQQSLSGLALYRCETENAPMVVFEEKLHPTDAQQALRVKDDDQGGRWGWRAHSASAVVFLTSSITA